MRYLVTRYVLWELSKVFLSTLLAMTLLIVLVGIAQEAIRQGLGIMPIVRLIPYVLPDALRFSVPATILFAVCSVYGRMASMNEVVAIKSMGISPTLLIWPALTLAFLLSLVAVWLNDVAVSWGRTGVRRVVVQSAEQIAYGMLRTQRVYSNQRFSINVKSVEGRRLMRPTITFHSSGDSPPVVLTAQEAELRFNAEDNTLSIFLYNGTVDVGGEVSMYFPDRIERVVSLGQAADADSLHERPSYCPLWKISDEVASQRDNITELEQSMAAEAAYQMVAGDLAGLGGSDWTGRYRNLAVADERLHRLHTEPWRRWANGFSCFFFCMVGVPLAMLLRKSDFITSFFICFLPILVVYYPLMAIGVDRAKSGGLPPYSVWLGNVICLLVGLWLMRRVVKH